MSAYATVRSLSTSRRHTTHGISASKTKGSDKPVTGQAASRCTGHCEHVQGSSDVFQLACRLKAPGTHGHLWNEGMGQRSLLACAVLMVLGLIFSVNKAVPEARAPSSPDLSGSQPFSEKQKVHVTEPWNSTARSTLLVSSGAVAGSPFKVDDSELHKELFLPVFLEADVLHRNTYPFRHMPTFEGNWTVTDPAQAVFYVVCCGPIDRMLRLPPRTPERPYLCYDCDAALTIGRLRSKEVFGQVGISESVCRRRSVSSCLQFRDVLPGRFKSSRWSCVAFSWSLKLLQVGRRLLAELC